MIENPALEEKIQELSCFRFTHDRPILEAYDHDLDKCLFTLLDLPNLRHLTIRSYSKTIGYNVCRDDIFGYRTMIDRYLDSGKLTNLVLEGVINLPIHLILTCKNLRTLDLRTVTLVAPSSPQQPLSQDTFALQRLSLYHVSGFPRSILKHVAASLESLELEHTQYSYDTMLSVLHPHDKKLIHFGRLTSLTSISGVDWETFLGDESRAGCKALSVVKHLSVQLYYDDVDHQVSSVNTILDHVEVLEKLDIIGTSRFNHLRNLLVLSFTFYWSLLPHKIHLIVSLCNFDTAMGPYLSPIRPRLSSNVIIGMHHTLKSFNLTILHYDFSQEFIAALVDSFISQPHYALENLELKMTFRVFDPSQIDSSGTTSYRREWRKLVSCLMVKDRFSCLRHVGIRTTLRLSVQKFMGYNDEQLEALLKEPLHDEGFFESTNRGFEVKFGWGTLVDPD